MVRIALGPGRLNATPATLSICSGSNVRGSAPDAYNHRVEPLNVRGDVVRRFP